MSAQREAVSWNRTKLIYDAALAVLVLAYLYAFMRLAPALGGGAAALDAPSLEIKAYGSCAFLLLTLALAIGPAARLDRRFLPLLYNRRHLGVVTFLVALAHANAVLGWYFAYSPRAPLVALLSSEPALGAAPGLPFVPLGILALLLLFALAATSHDFWLAFLTPKVWKALHMSLYAAYALVVAHIGFGAAQVQGGLPLAGLVAGCAAGLVVLHLAAGLRAARLDAPAALAAATPWLRAGPAASIPEGAAIVIRPPQGEAIAIFRHQNRLSAVTNLCAHQNGPLGEGRVVDGCITCPWHGFQYRLEDGCAPPPYSEKLPTYHLALEGDTVLVDPRANPPGTFVPPLVLP